MKYETEISKPGELRKILEFLDFKKVITIDKKREYWDCGDFEVCLDSVQNLGFFIEVEAKKDFGGTEKTRKMCAVFLERLGVKDLEERSVKTGYPDLLFKNKAL